MKNLKDSTLLLKVLLQRNEVESKPTNAKVFSTMELKCYSQTRMDTKLQTPNRSTAWFAFHE